MRARIKKFGDPAGKTLRTLSFPPFHWGPSNVLSGLRMKGNFVINQYLNSFGARQTLAVGGKTYAYYSLHAAEKNGLSSVSRLPLTVE